MPFRECMYICIYTIVTRVVKEAGRSHSTHGQRFSQVIRKLYSSVYVSETMVLIEKARSYSVLSIAGPSFRSSCEKWRFKQSA